jgi:hypothetical protein
MVKNILLTFKTIRIFPLPSKGRIREGVESSKVLPILSFTPHAVIKLITGNPSTPLRECLIIRERELKT